MADAGVLRGLSLLVCLAMTAGEARAGAKPEPKLDPPEPPANLAELGSRIQRTMTLLATSTPQKRRRVRILFYGQSVTRNPWWKTVPFPSILSWGSGQKPVKTAGSMHNTVSASPWQPYRSISSARLLPALLTASS